MRGSPRRATVAARHAVRRAQPARTPARPSPPRHQAKTPFTRAQAAPKKEQKLIPTIMGMATGNPPYRASQEQALQVAESCPECTSIKPVLARIYGNSRIDYRYMAVPDFTPEQRLEGDDNFFDDDLNFRMPVEKRLDKFREVAVPLVTDVCARALKDAGVQAERDRQARGCFFHRLFGPGPGLLAHQDARTRKKCRPFTHRLHGLRGGHERVSVANDYAASHPGKLALMVCVEISSVHTTFDDNVNDAILHAIFADGCAAAVISGEKPGLRQGQGQVRHRRHARLAHGGHRRWHHFIDQRERHLLHPVQVPAPVHRQEHGRLRRVLPGHAQPPEERHGLLGHPPRGRRIIEEAQNGLGLSEEQAKYSWNVLSNYGNMLSPSVMFVLELILNDHKKALASGERGLKQGIAFSFSPGVGAEGVLIKVM